SNSASHLLSFGRLLATPSSELVSFESTRYVIFRHVASPYHFHFGREQAVAQCAAARSQHPDLFGIRAHLAGYFRNGKRRPAPDAPAADRSIQRCGPAHRPMLWRRAADAGSGIWAGQLYAIRSSLCAKEREENLV